MGPLKSEPLGPRPLLGGLPGGRAQLWRRSVLLRPAQTQGMDRKPAGLGIH